MICREVLEHLTVLEVKRAVANMVRMTSKFIYVTTRFHPNPSSLLDFTTQFDVDPSHITLLNKDMLRLMFVLEGCRSRPDLEAKMDWGNKDRVLIKADGEHTYFASDLAYIDRKFERGATRADDRASEAAMEDRKREGYF